jgi:hypothetical protein
MLRTYVIEEPFLRCSECDTIVVDGDTHDRWHAEKEAIEDPNQGSLFA